MNIFHMLASLGNLRLARAASNRERNKFHSGEYKCVIKAWLKIN